MIAIILAAGYATRLRPLTEHMPKALLSVGSVTMLDRLMRGIASIPNLQRACLVTNDRFYPQFVAWHRSAAANYPRLTIDILNDGTDSDQNKRGAVGDMQFTIEQLAIDDDILVCASDNLFTFPLTDFVADFQRTGKDTLLMSRVYDIDLLRRFAVATLDESGRVTGLVEKPSDPPSNIGVYALYLYRKDTVPLIAQYLAEGNSPDAPGHFPEWLHTRKEVRGYLFQGECIDIGTPDVYYATCARYEKGGDLHG